MDPRPLYLTEVNFYEAVGISYRYGAKLLGLGVLCPDAFLNDEDRPLFDPRALDRHRAAIKSYEARQVAARHNLKDLSRV